MGPLIDDAWERRFVFDRFALQAQEVGHDSSADADNRVWLGWCANVHTRFGRLDCNHLHGRLEPFKILSCTSYAAASPYSMNEIIDAAFSCFPDLRPRCLDVCVWVVEICELCSSKIVVRRRGNEFLVLLEDSLNAFTGCCQVNVPAELPDDHHSFEHCRNLGHDDDALISLGCADHGNPNPGVAGRTLDDGHPGLELSRAFR
mmetsp:Transcript_56429/g.93260  ORF Transcript_56429/g.93260 Transcript_56429/m.93260 type:complete len:203 (-) Transcript_56429:346-954(-)